ncbi:DNA replication factor Cdt1 isoform X2 [Topomyia yanbarensis]|uniref:DNA replication factor Cdt1 isoform X2 n=1 Tax=Topomyia yanbarensis TaxID=2498891 RepID=UPI00273B8D4C|nr:DNA replication factor Cdt1 isoform X2 [Topomyia yanbarensis]
MSQPTVAAYFNARKRAAADEIGAATRNKNAAASSDVESNVGNDSEAKRITRATRAIRRIGAVTVNEKTREMLEQPKLVNFFKKGALSPRKKPTITRQEISAEAKNVSKAATSSTAEFLTKNNVNNVERGTKTPTKKVASNLGSGSVPNISNMSVEETRNKLSRSARLADLKTSLNKMRGGLEKLDRLKSERLDTNKKPLVPPSPKTAARNLKEFQTLEVEVPVSPQKPFMSPTKTLHRTPTKASHSSLMSPTKNVTPKRLSALMSPIKEPSPTPIMASPTKLPAYQRFQHLTETGRPTLQLPYKYRCLGELFKCIDTVCAMYHNRKEQITFKKLKPAVQRMARKNLYESHLAQIKTLFPEAFAISLELTKNYGSATKHETYQLVIKPNVKEKAVPAKLSDEDSNVIRSAQNQSMNPQVMIERLHKFNRLLLQKAMDAHQKFLLDLDPPMRIPREKLTCWHPDFNLESCPDIEQAELPQPPNVERFSSAKDVLSASRNLFNCSTAMERALERLEEKKRQTTGAAPITSTTNIASPLQVEKGKIEHPYHAGLKNVPKSLLEKIRAKQAAKALDQMTRRPSIEQEAIKYGRLPELARHLRNVFVTERKSVLPLEIVLVKIENSYRGRLTLKELEEHLKMIAQIASFWLTLTEVRKTMYAKIVKDYDMTKVIEPLEKKANELLNG